MDLWRGSLAEFVRLAECRALAGEISKSFINIYQLPPSEPETRSWINSLPFVAKALHGLGRTDVGVAVAGSSVDPPGLLRFADGAGTTPWGAPDVGVLSEYHLPLSNKHIDVLLCRTGEDRRSRAIYLLLLAHDLGIDLAAAVDEKITANETRYTVEGHRGVAKKAAKTGPAG